MEEKYDMKRVARDVTRTRLAVESAKDVLMNRRPNCDWNGMRFIDDAVSYLDSCIEGLSILEENQRERY